MWLLEMEIVSGRFGVQNWILAVFLVCTLNCQYVYELRLQIWLYQCITWLETD